MQLANKKSLAAKILKVGKGRVSFISGHEEEIKEAITRQDILDLHNRKVIKIKEIGGRKKIKTRKHRRRTGKIKKKVKTRKQDYVKLIRKLRANIRGLFREGKIDKDKKNTLRKMSRANKFRSKRHLNESLEGI